MTAKGGIAAGLTAVLLAPLALIGVGVLAVVSVDSCGTSAVVDVDGAGGKNVAGYAGEQLTNAAHILHAGAELGLTKRDQTIGVMTAMGESSLKVLEYGDAAGPDSRGLFQQRDHYGPLEDRLDPRKSSTMFFSTMVKAVPDPERQTLAPTLVAHRTQINADPYHYEKYWAAAEEVVAALGGGAASESCEEGTAGTVGKNGWAAPAQGPVNSSYGNRGGGFHSGVDLNGGGCGGPIWAAYPGTVTYVGLDSLSNGVVYIDHAGKIETRYVHMYLPDIYVKAGQKVKAAHRI